MWSDGTGYSLTQTDHSKLTSDGTGYSHTEVHLE